MKRILVGLTLLAVIAGGAVAFGQSSGAPDPLTARIAELQNVYRQVVVDITGLEAQLKDLNSQKLRLEGGIMELQRYQAQVRPQTTGIVLPPETEDTAAETE